MRGIVLSTVFAALCVPGWAADQAQAPAKQPDVNVDEIIQKFAAKEAEFQEARNNYVYRQSVKLEELDSGGNPTGGKWELVEDVIFTPEGKRMEKVVYAPVVSLKNIGLTQEDERDLRDVQPFVLTTKEIPEYNINYLGREKIDEIGTYSFAVKPKKVVPGKRYFEGTIWVDDRDLQIVKTYGKGVGELKKGASKNQAFPRFETYREQIDGKYWFPTYTHADDVLHFPPPSMDQRIRMTVRYTDYKKYEGKSTIKYGDVIEDGTKPATATPPPAKKK
jgi:hypothetical protein